jgi:hypothetical protein
VEHPRFWREVERFLPAFFQRSPGLDTLALGLLLHTFRGKVFSLSGGGPEGARCFFGNGGMVSFPLRLERAKPVGSPPIKSLLLLLEFSLVIRVLRAISDFSACEIRTYRKPVHENPQSICTRKPQWYRSKFTGCGSLLTGLVHVRSQKRTRGENLLWIT